MQPAPPPADRPEAENVPVLQREPLAAGTHRRGVELRPLLNVLSLVLAVAVVVVAAGIGLQRLRSEPPNPQANGMNPTIPPPTSPLFPVTPATILPAGQGWLHTGPSWAQDIAFAPSSPRTAYLCGTPANNDPRRQALVALGTSRDAGHTWQTWNTGLLADACQVDVDPTSSQHLLLHLLTCLPCSAAPPAQIALSEDGGRSWQRTPLPALPGSSAPVNFVAAQWAWQGSALFVMPFFAGIQTRRLLAISVAGEPFAWVNEGALLAGVPPDMQLNDIYATTAAVYADFDYTSPANCYQTCVLTKVSTDLGATWSVFQPHDHSNTVSLLDQGVSMADGHTLIGQAFPNGHASARAYVRSSDGGRTWTPLPSPPGDLLIGMLAFTPGGILYAELVSVGGPATATQGVYLLAPGAGAWALVGALPNSGLLVVSWDEQGNPLALWSGAATPSDQAISAGLATHAP